MKTAENGHRGDPFADVDDAERRHRADRDEHRDDLDLDIDIEQLQQRYEANLAAADRTLKAAQREAWVKGSAGQRRAHPGFAIAAKCDELVLRYQERLEELRKRRN